MKSKNSKISKDELESILFQRLDEISVNPDGTPRTDARKIVAIFETENDDLGRNSKVFGEVYDKAEQALSNFSFDSDFLSDIVLMAMSIGGLSLGKEDLIKNHLRDLQVEKAFKRHSYDPKQADKSIVKECWFEWQAEPLGLDLTKKYKGKAAFSRDMLDKFPNLESQPVIEKWCRSWEREVKKP